MDAEGFDLLVRMCGLHAARRGIMSVLLGGVLGFVLNDLHDTDAKRGRRQQVIAEKRKRRKKKKKKNKNLPAPRDEAPPCTTASCPLPPNCSQSVVDSCNTALFDDIVTAAQACEAACQDSSSQTCQACIEPIVETYSPDAFACAEAGCGVSLSSRASRFKARSGEVTAEEWWTRTCDKACCQTPLKACEEDVRDELFVCLAGAVVAAATTGPGSIPVLAGCMARLFYGMSKCRAREGCEDGGSCLADGTCCAGQACGGLCCAPGKVCTSGTYNGTVRSNCCTPNSLELGPCDGICCGTPANVSMCCPGKSNPCTATAVGCG